jgi:hypothetical protein
MHLDHAGLRAILQFVAQDGANTPRCKLVGVAIHGVCADPDLAAGRNGGFPYIAGL